jgi:hypothetical protein
MDISNIAAIPIILNVESGGEALRSLTLLRLSTPEDRNRI